MRLPFLPRRQSSRSAEQPIGYYLNAGGQLEPLLAGKASGLAGLTMHGYGAYSRMPITSTPQGYAYASIASVWAFRCIELRSQAVNRVRWFVRQVNSDKEIPDHPLTIALRRSRQKMIRKLEWSKLIWGETFIYPRPNLSGYISDLSWLNNLGMTVDTTPGYIREFQYMPVNGGPMIRFVPEELAYLYTDNPFDDLRGLSRFESVLVDIGIDRDVARTTRAFYLNDTRVGLLLLTEQNLSPDQRQQIMDFWKANLKGPENAGKPVILPNAISDVKEVQRAPSIDDVDLRESVRRAICAGFGVPLSLAGAWDDAQYQSAPEQRKSFYEETIVPECEEIRDDLNDVLMPFFDDKRQSEIDFDPSGLLALTENAAEKETMLNARLTSGGIMLNEYRNEIELPLLPGGNVFYVPGGITRVPMAEIGLPTPPPQASSPFAFPGLARPPLLPNGGGNGDGTPVQEERAALPIHTYDAPRLDAPIIITKQADADDELDAWERKALNGGATKALKFACNHLDADMQTFVRDGLAVSADKAACRRVFAEAREHLKKNDVAELLSATPEEYALYWGEYDRLMGQVGNAWIDAYMQRAWRRLRDQLRDNMITLDLDAALEPFRDDLAQEWVGNEDNPGIMTRLILAGMAAGNQSLIANRPADPHKPLKVTLTVDWTLLNKEALGVAGSYVYDLIRGLDATTRADVQNAMVDWIASREPLSALETTLRSIFIDPVRAENIAQTESTRVYHEGAKERWQQVGVTQARWQTVRDQHVCPICQPLHGAIADLNTGWQSSKGNVQPPAHPRCRCFAKPVLRLDDLREPGFDITHPGLDPDTLPVQDALRKKQAEVNRIVNRIQAAGERQQQKILGLQQKLEGMQERNDAEWRHFNDLFDRDQAAAVRYRNEVIYPHGDEMDSVFQELQKLYRADKQVIQKAALAAVRKGKDTTITPSFRPEQGLAQDKTGQKNANEATRWLRKIVNGDTYYEVYDPDVKKAIEKRASYTYGTQELNMQEGEPVWTYVHEWGHLFEYNEPRVHDRAVEFLKYRTRNREPQSLRELTGQDEYRTDEIAALGGFQDAYVGKIYPNYRSTEIVSMGLQYLYQDPAQFAARDPEFFNFIVSLVRGEI